MTALPTAPLPTDDTATFNTRAFALVAALGAFVTEANALETNVNTKESSATAAASSAASSALAATGSANFKGEWSTLSGALAIPAAVSYSSKVWILTESVSNVLAEVPGVSTKWISANITDFTNLSVSSALTVTGTSDFSGVSTFSAIKEKTTVSATAATGTINFDCSTQPVLYYTTNASANWTMNFRGTSSVSLNSLMAIGQALTVTFLATQGATAYYNSAVQIDGLSVTPKWQSGIAPNAGNINSVDSYTYAIIKTGNAAFTVLASQTKYA